MVSISHATDKGEGTVAMVGSALLVAPHKNYQGVFKLISMQQLINQFLGPPLPTLPTASFPTFPITSCSALPVAATLVMQSSQLPTWAPVAINNCEYATLLDASWGSFPQEHLKERKAMQTLAA